MLLRLVPPPPLPTILFTISFPTLPDSLPLPAAWDAHLQLLANIHLAAPPSLHALDKSVAWTALLDTVTFDLASLTVTCTFIDGVQEEWPLTNRCVDLLESVIRDVNRSAAEAEAEHELQYREIDNHRGQISHSNSHASLPCVDDSPEQPTPAVVQKVPKPKKRRSILASLMASLVPSSSFSGSASPARVVTPPPAPAPVPPAAVEESEPLVTNGIAASRFLRRRARSTLVDAFRRFVVGELGTRFRTGEPSTYRTRPPSFKGDSDDVSSGQTPQYALWVVRSTMRRVAEEMARVIEYALYSDEARERDCERGRGRNGNKNKDDDDRDGDDAGSASSTTDGSSVHTPLDFHDLPSPHSQHRHVSVPHSPTILTPQAYEAYVSLKSMHHRLHDLACQLTAHATAQDQAAAADAGVAEVRSKRRAWSTRQYLAGSGSRSELGKDGGRKEDRVVLGGASMSLVGLAVPTRSSPLCRGWNAEDLEDVAEQSRPRPQERRVKWDTNLERGAMLRRARSLYGEQGQRGRCVEVTERSHEAEDVHDLERIRARTVGVIGEGRPGLIYSTVARYTEVDPDTDGDADEHNDDDEDEDADEDDHAKQEEADDDLYEKRSEEEFILHPTEEAPRSPPRAWLSHLKIPQLALPKAALPKDLRPGRSMPIALPRLKLLPSAAAAIDDYCAVSTKLPDPNPACVAAI